MEVILLAVTAQQVFDLSMSLIDEIQENGLVNAGNTAGYKAKTPKLLTMLQTELARAEGVTPTILTSINDSLALSDYTAINVLPWGLAALLVIEENEITAPYFNARYEELKKKIPVSPVAIEDVYGGLDMGW